MTDKAETALTRLTDFEKRAEPGNFLALFGLIGEFSGIGGSLADVEKESLVLVFRKSFFVARKLMGCVDESAITGPLRTFDAAERRNEFDQNLGTVFRALRTEEHRHDFLSLLVFSTVACTARFVLSIYPYELTPWSAFLQAVDYFPSLGRLATGCDCTGLRYGHTRESERIAQCWREFGFESIMLGRAFSRTRLDALGAWIESFQSPASCRVSLLEECAAKLGMALSFLLTVEAPNWKVAPFNSLHQGTSLTAIIRELMSHKLKLVSLADSVYEPIWPLAFRHLGSGPAGRLCHLTTGTIRRKQYLVELAEFQFLTREPVPPVQAEWDLDPLEFTRKNMRNIPSSNQVEAVQRSIEVIERELFDARIAAAAEKGIATVNPILEEVSPEALALVLVESLKLTPYSTPIFTYIFRRLHRLLIKSKDSAS